MAMSEWQPLLQSIFIGLIFSFLVAKLISIVVSFKDDNLTVTRNTESNSQSNKSVVLLDENPLGLEADLGLRLADETESMIAELGSVRNESLPCSDYGDDDDDWEGVESTELDEMFSAATAFVAATAATSSGQKVSSDVQLQLYGLYKIATEGPCSTPQPSALKMTARAKWQAWQKLGAMPPEVAMQKYIDIVTELYPTWAAGLSAKSRGGDDDAVTRESKGPMGPVFSSLVYEEEPGNELRMDAIHAFAREGDVNNLVTCIENGVSVNLREMPSSPAAHLQNSSPELFVELIDLLSERNTV
ncbi:acyl-CoA-binding domain-containing protein 1-like isoform X2 [Mangifera indica]|uniref:acyl-CoA-binding domain-containing protein 1-like isoform X2 n=1 Tax=Mangifera indica TaxID=29780 RepID=UPI001CFA8E4B|nr:acyl-CoA-binding domain-containing protein 1-like isoform X2 [Mangifera indica]